LDNSTHTIVPEDIILIPEFAGIRIFEWPLAGVSSAQALAEHIRSTGGRAMVPVADERFEVYIQPKLYSNWSERHAAIHSGTGNVQPKLRHYYGKSHSRTVFCNPDSILQDLYNFIPDQYKCFTFRVYLTFKIDGKSPVK